MKRCKKATVECAGLSYTCYSVKVFISLEYFCTMSTYQNDILNNLYVETVRISKNNVD